MKVKLNQEQAEALPFPIGCSVWYNFPGKSTADLQTEEPPILKRGVVESVSVSFNAGENDLLYDVVYTENEDKKNSIREEVSGHDLAYGANCPVTIDSNGDGPAAEGTILLCEPSSSDPTNTKKLYTAMIFMEGCQARFEFGIDSERIKYRKVTDTKAAAAQNGGALCATANIQVKQQSATKNDPSSPPAKGTVPSSITCDSVGKSNSKEGGAGSKRARMSDTASPSSPPPKKNSLRVDNTTTLPHIDAHIKQDSRRSITSQSRESGSNSKSMLPHHRTHMPDTSSTLHASPKRPNNSPHESESHRSITSQSHNSSINQQRMPGHQNRLDISIPLWLQRNHSSQRELFYWLIDSTKSHGGMHGIGRETNCHINVKFNPDPPTGLGFVNPPMSIIVVSPSPHKPLREFKLAREKITEKLLDYVDMRRDGARGRLVYDISVCCGGSHRPNKSTSRAVNVKNPFDDNDKLSFMSVVDLPSEVYKGEREFHAAYLLKSKTRVLSRISSQTGCHMRVCGDDFNIPTAYCDPYVLVTGKSFQDVDRAVEIVKDEIGRHMNTCFCRLR